MKESFEFKFDLGGSKPEKKTRPPTSEETAILADLVKKAGDDTLKAMSTTVDLAGDTAGLAGVFLVVQKVGQSFMQGSALTLGAIRKVMKGQTPPDKTKLEEEDLLFVCLLAFCAENGHKDSMDRAMMMFHKLKGYKYDLPSEWAGPRL